MKFLLVLFLSLLSFAACAKKSVDGKLRPFKSDGCTLSPDGNWGECCEAHDLRLWGGGTEAERIDADKKLYACMKEKAGELMANIFYTGIRIGSYSPIKIPSKVWGNAWYTRGYYELTEAQIFQLVDELNRTDGIPEDLRATYRQELEARLTH